MSEIPAVNLLCYLTRAMLSMISDRLVTIERVNAIQYNRGGLPQ
jgi:hypothetical protein